MNEVVQKEFTLTTVDNPFNPFDDFVNWFLFDIEKGYDTCSYLGRIVELNEDMSEIEVDKAVELAIDKIIEYDFLNIYKKVCREDYKKLNNK